ncbi:MAG TPA: SCO family protein [Candidatus Eisenbacteria bacterium]|nr:SCO family protein [Candidatus Eisenbacteria bacterium]
MQWTLLLLFWILAPAPAATAHDQEPSSPPSAAEIADNVAIEQRLNAEVPPDLTFTDETGQPVTLGRYFDGKPVLLALVYFDCPQLCPMVLDGLARSLRPLALKAGADYRVVAISIDPDETADLARSKKQSLMARSHLEPAGWHFLTGDRAAIDAVAQTVGFRYLANSKAERDRYIHASGAIVLTPEGKVSRYLYGFDYPPRDLRLALIEASGSRIGSPVDQLLLLCYQYDPAQGKYTLSILNLLRASGAATALGLAALVVLMVRRERHAGRVRVPSGGRSR